MGLGNPGKQYQNSRHNAGYMALATFVKVRNFSDPSRTGRSLISKAHFEGQRIIMAWPQTYMNNSGQAARDLLNFYKENSTNLLVIHDDMDIPVGKLKVTSGGGSGGHNGLISIIEEIGEEFDRLRVGIGRPQKGFFGGDYAPYVLSSFDQDELEGIDGALDLAAQAIGIWVHKGVAACQRKINVKPKRPKEETESAPAGLVGTQAGKESPQAGQEGFKAGHKSVRDGSEAGKESPQASQEILQVGHEGAQDGDPTSRGRG
jgi:PTH1 family peptidyl-tRNA hydrolase